MRAWCASRPSRACIRIPWTRISFLAAPIAIRRSHPSGWTEDRAKEGGREIRVGRFPFVGNGKAIALGEDQGAGEGGLRQENRPAALGAHMIGAEVTELIQGYVVAMNLETTEEELMHTIFPHPTLSEMMKEAVLDAYGRVLNM